MKIGKVDSADVRRHARRAKVHTVRGVKFVHRHALSSRKRLIITAAAVLVVPILLVQLFYPAGTLLPNTTVGSVKLGGDSKLEATEKLDKAYAHAVVPVYFTDSNEVVVEPTLSELGVTVANEARVEEFNYPFISRMVPYSLFWYQAFMDKGEPAVARNDDTFAAYMANRFGEDCEFEPVNGTISYIDGSLQVVDAARGGSCDINELTSKLEAVSVRLTPEKVTVSGTSRAPEVSTEDAKKEFTRLTKQLNKGVALKVEDKSEKVPTNTLEEWIEYSVVEGKLTLRLNSEKTTKWLSDKYAKQFTSDPGTTVISTRDFAEVSRETGKSGQTLNTGSTIAEIVKDLNEETYTAKLAIDTVEPAVTYKRSYSSSNAGLSAVMKNYASSHPGTYGVKMVELSGARRNAEYNSTKQFTTASTYKMFVAYSILLRIERGEIQWTDASYGGQTVSTCFDKMISLSNNECAIYFLKKVGFAGVTNDAHAIGAKSTTFLGNNGIKSTASDEALLLSLLQTGQILSQQASRDRMINAMKKNVYVKGIPSGIQGAEIADKVGFLDALLHDAAIVYSPSGTYVLIILTDNASWGNIAELAKEIEAVRSSKG